MSFSHDDVWRDAVMGAVQRGVKSSNLSGAAEFAKAMSVAKQEAFEKQSSDGSTASYYELPANATELQDLISYRDMNGQLAEIFRACYRYGIVAHSPKIRDIKKIIFYAQAELKRLETYGEKHEN